MYAPGEAFIDTMTLQFVSIISRSIFAGSCRIRFTYVDLFAKGTFGRGLLSYAGILL
jgi:hypothetical protein